MRDAFYAAVSRDLFYGSLPDWQRRPLDLLIDEAHRRDRRLQEVAYVLASAYHESSRFRYKEEIGHGEGKAYGASCPLMGTGSKVTKSAVYFGRGWIQNTWLENFAKLSIAASLHFGRPIDLVNNPDLLTADDELQAWCLWHGFVTGIWTTRNLADYFGEGRADYIGARAIVNGNDRAEQIAGYARQFEAALELIGDTPSADGGRCPMGHSACPGVV